MSMQEIKKKDYNDKRPLIIANRVIIKGQIISIGTWRLSELEKIFLFRKGYYFINETTRELGSSV